MKIELVKLNEKAVIPAKAHPTDAGLDLTAISSDLDESGNMVYGTGLALNIPSDYAGLIFPRSSVSNKTLSLANSVGLIDAGYQGEIKLKFKPTVYFDSRTQEGFEYEVGDRVGQLLILPVLDIEFTEVKEFQKTARGTSGFGSSGN